MALKSCAAFFGDVRKAESNCWAYFIPLWFEAKAHYQAGSCTQNE
jgi:hypothetical protein